MNDKKEAALAAFGELMDIMEELRAKCPWDREQTWKTLRTLTLEEVYELADSILEDDPEGISEELGDLLLHIVFYAKIGDEKQVFDMADVVHKINKKLIFRHPHVFGEVTAETTSVVKENWERLKLQEKTTKTVLGGIPEALPALIKAYRIQDKARGVGFDWVEKEAIWNKVNEELGELKYELEHGEDPDRVEGEFGDFLFSMVNTARLYGINPENALERCNLKFIRRFNFIENESQKTGIQFHELTLEEMDNYWDEAKKRGL